MLSAGVDGWKRPITLPRCAPLSTASTDRHLSASSQNAFGGKSAFGVIMGNGGVPYLSADDVFTANPYSQRNILVAPDDGHEDYFVREGWLLMACSGQVYGLNGTATIATRWHENVFFSHDLIRIEPKEGVRAGYLLIALTHPTLGRPLLMREAYGMSISHLDAGYVAAFPVVRLDADLETEIADLAEAAVVFSQVLSGGT